MMQLEKNKNYNCTNWKNSKMMHMKVQRYTKKTKAFHDRKILLKQFQLGQRVLFFQFKVEVIPWKIKI